MSEWISVDDRLPEVSVNEGISEEVVCIIEYPDGERYVDIDNLTTATDSKGNKEIGWSCEFASAHNDMLKVIYWMPLPPPPRRITPER